MSLAMARIRLLVADAYRHGCRQQGDPNRETARELVSQAMQDLEFVLRAIRDAATIESGQRAASHTAAWLRAPCCNCHATLHPTSPPAGGRLFSGPLSMPLALEHPRWRPWSGSLTR